MGVIRTTGPSAYTLAVHPILSTAPHRLTTEEEMDISISILDYDHAATFPRHYSTLTIPVARLSALGKLAQTGVERLRRLKQSIRPKASR